jgi:hypothetical protein
VTTPGEIVSRPRIVPVDYDQFLAELRKATDIGKRIDASDKARWSAWVKQNNIREAAFKSVGSNQFDGLKAVIIDDPGAWGGYYLYTTSEEACLKWMKAED